MNNIITLTIVFLTSLSAARAEVPAAVMSQLHSDLASGMRASSPQATEDQIAQEWAVFEKQAHEAGTDVSKSFTFTASEVEAFTSGKEAPTNDELKKSISELTEMIPAKAFPHLLAFYEKLRAENKLTSQQRVLHLRTCRLVVANIKRHIEDSDKKP